MDKVYCCAVPLSSASQQHQAAVDAGKPPRSIYVEGRGAETFDACVAQFRNGGTLGLVGGLRVLGTSRTAIVARVRILRAKGITPYDLDTGETDPTELLNSAVQRIAGARAMKENPRQAKRIGRKGGIARGVASKERRNAILAEAIIQRICTAPELNWRRRVEILGGAPFSKSTLQRRYGAGSKA